MSKQQQVKRIFDSISGRYDLLNHLLSAGIDIYWRNKAIKFSGMNRNSKLLDIACGTGDFAITARKNGIMEITGADLSKNMLDHFHLKAEWSIGRTIQSVAENLPFAAASFTNITVAFGVRNFYNIPEAFREFFRVLQPSGKATILEFRLPKNLFVRKFYLFYFNRVLPLIGKIISKDQEAYHYLPESVGEFDKNVNLPELLTKAGFREVKTYSLTFGIVQIVVAEK